MNRNNVFKKHSQTSLRNHSFVHIVGNCANKLLLIILKPVKEIMPKPQAASVQFLAGPFAVSHYSALKSKYWQLESVAKVSKYLGGLSNEL